MRPNASVCGRCGVIQMNELKSMLEQVRAYAKKENEIRSLIRRGRAGVKAQARMRQYRKLKFDLWAQSIYILRKKAAPPEIIYICRQHFLNARSWEYVSAKLYGDLCWNWTMAYRKFYKWIETSGV